MIAEVHAREVLADDAEREELAPEKIAIIDARNGKPGTALPLDEVAHEHEHEQATPKQREREADEARDLQRPRAEAGQHVERVRRELPNV